LYAAGDTYKKQYKNIRTVYGSDWFLNYVEYDAKDISPDKANATFMTQPLNCACGGMCTGVHKGTMQLRQLDWYYNEEVEFVIKMNKCLEKGVKYSSIGVTAASPKLTWKIVRDHILNNRYNPYFDILPYLTVDGVNEKGIFAQSNVVEVNGVEHININPTSKNDCCCSIMLVRFILDHVGNINELEDYLNTLHLYNAPRDKVVYNNHVMVSDSLGNTRIIEFKENSFEIISSFPVMTNFRTNNGFKANGISADWTSVEHNGIGLERWETGMTFVNDGNPETLQGFKTLRNELNYTHAYDRPFEKNVTWLTDNLSSDLSVCDAFNYHHDLITDDRKEIYDGSLSEYRKMYDNRSRIDGNKTWITTHGAIYDLANLSCNLQTQQNTIWNITFDGNITEDIK